MLTRRKKKNGRISSKSQSVSRQLSVPSTLFLIFNYSPSCNHFISWSFLPSLPQSSIPLPFSGLHPPPLLLFVSLFFFFSFCHSLFHHSNHPVSSPFSSQYVFEHMIYSHRVHATRKRKGDGAR